MDPFQMEKIIFPHCYCPTSHYFLHWLISIKEKISPFIYFIFFLFDYLHPVSLCWHPLQDLFGVKKKKKEGEEQSHLNNLSLGCLFIALNKLYHLLTWVLISRSVKASQTSIYMGYTAAQHVWRWLTCNPSMYVKTMWYYISYLLINAMHPSS